MKKGILALGLMSGVFASSLAAYAESSSGFTIDGVSGSMCTHMVTGTISYGLEAHKEYPELQEMIRVLGAECGLNSAPSKISSKPIMYVVEGTTIAFLNDSQKVSFGTQALAAVQFQAVSPSTQVIVIPADKTSKGAISQQKDKVRIETRVEGSSATATATVAVQAPVESGFAARIQGKLGEIYRNGETEVYLSGIAYHDRSSYGADKIAELNEKAYGIGFGKSITNENGNYESIYAMAFLDSHSDPQYNVGYMWQKIFKLNRGNSVGVGYTAGVMSRADIANRFPIPFALPAASLNIGKVSLMAVLIPKLNGGINHGNVLFIFAKLPIEKIANPITFK